MKLGVREVMTIIGLTTLSCNSQEAPNPELTNGVETTRAYVGKALDPRSPFPTEADLTRNQLTDACTPTGQPLLGEQFPMRRGTERIKTLNDGTCLERSTDNYDGGASVIYAINGNRKIKFVNPNPRQETKILGQNDFGDLQRLGIALMKEAQANGTNLLRILFEGPIVECPTYRYRRSMAADEITAVGDECIWDERSIVCPRFTTATDSSFILWQAVATDGKYAIPDTAHPRPDQFGPGVAPTPQEWLGTQPRCPGPDSVVNRI